LDPKIIQLGFNKCGTTSLSLFLNRNGIKTCHWERGQIAEDFYSRMGKGEPPLCDWDKDFIGFTDLNKVTHRVLLEPYKHFEYMYKFYPDAYYILITRNIRDWVKSRINHSNLASSYLSCLNLDYYEELVSYWELEWYNYHASVMRFFGTKGNVLLYDIDKDDPKALCEFLKPDFGQLNPDMYKHEHKTIDRPNNLCRLNKSAIDLINKL